MSMLSNRFSHNTVVVISRPKSADTTMIRTSDEINGSPSSVSSTSRNANTSAQESTSSCERSLAQCAAYVMAHHHLCV